MEKRLNTRIRRIGDEIFLGMKYINSIKINSKFLTNLHINNLEPSNNKAYTVYRKQFAFYVQRPIIFYSIPKYFFVYIFIGTNNLFDLF